MHKRRPLNNKRSSFPKLFKGLKKIIYFIFLILLVFMAADKVAAGIEKALKRNAFLYHIFPKKIKKSPIILPHKEKPKLAIIIDDAGYVKDTAQKFFELDKALTISILPFSPYAKELAEEAYKKGIEVTLHLPMEPKGYPKIDPGPGALLSSMPFSEFEKTLNQDLNAIPHIKGVNNHMGSMLTEIPLQMNWVFASLQKRGLFFIDSETTPKSICKRESAFFHIPFAANNLFLDNIRNEQAIITQIKQLIKIAKQKGQAIGIGHTNLFLYEALKKELPEIKSQVKLVSASELFESN